MCASHTFSANVPDMIPPPERPNRPRYLRLSPRDASIGTWTTLAESACWTRPLRSSAHSRPARQLSRSWWQQPTSRVRPRNGEPVRGRTREVGCCHQLRESCRAGLECAEDRSGLVQHADSARVVHVPILASRGLRRKYLGRFGRSGGGIMSGTLAEKVWDAHIVRRGTDGAPDLLYIDLHLVHEVTSPQAFEGLRLAGRRVRRPDLTIATEDHNTPTLDIDRPIADVTSRTQIQTLRDNAAEFGVRLHSLGDADQG